MKINLIDNNPDKENGTWDFEKVEMKLTDINSNNFETRQDAIEKLKTELQKYRDSANTEECESLLAEIKECLFYDNELVVIEVGK